MQSSILLRIDISLREPGLRVWIRVHIAPVPLFIRRIPFGRVKSDPRPEGCGFGFVAGQVDLDGEVGCVWAGVEDGGCACAGWALGTFVGVAVAGPLVC